MADKKIDKHIFNSIIQFLFLSILTFLAMVTPCIADDNLNVSKDRLQTVTLQLKWKHQFQFAGYYAALAKGYYSEVGLDVKILEIQSGEESINKVIDGKADFGIAMSDLILHRANGQPVVALASIFQHSPLIILTPKASGIENIHALKGKRLGLEAHSAELIAYLENEGISLEEIKLHPHEYSISNLISDEVDAISAYSTDEPFLLFNKGIEYSTFTPRSGGIDFYGDTLFTSEAQIKEDPERVSAFLNASLKGWQYALENREEIIDLILSKYTQRHSREHLLFEAQHSKTLIMADVVQLGYMHSGRWNHIAETYANIGQIDKDFSLKGFMYVPESGADYGWLKRRLLSVIGIAIAILAVILIWNRRLSREIHRRKQSEAVIKIKSEELEEANKELIAATEDLQAKKQSLLNEKIFAEALLECLPGYLYVYDDQGKLVRWNKKHETMTGYSAKELSQKNMSDWFEGEDAVRVAAAVDEVFKKGYGEVEAHLLIKGGGKLFIHSNGVRLTIDGKTYFVGVGIDITERKQVEKNLRESEARHGKMVANIGDVIVIIDQDGINKYKSPNIEKLFGWEPEDVVGASTWDIIHPDDIASAQTVFEKILSEPEAVETMECRYRCKDGSYKWIEFTGTNLLQDSDINGLLGNYHDITERKKLESQVQKAQKMESIGNLAGGIAHDFNNLLYPIIGYAEMLKEDLPKDSPEYKSAQEIFNAGKRGGELVKQILAFSRQADHKLSPVRFQKILTEVFKLTRSTIPSDIEIYQDIQKDCGLVMAEETQLHQIAMNLITNAYHAVEKTSGKISVQLKEIMLDNDDLKDSSLQTGQYVMLSVSDNGVGIPREIMNNIFEPYFTTKEKGKGTGLGLAVVYGILKEHKGDIKVYSEVGKGTTFNVYLPLMKKSDETISAEKVLNKPNGTESILLVDDEESIVRLEKQMLERLGYNVSARSNSLEALETFNSNPDGYDLVISDMTMPNMTGDQLAQELMSIRPDIPIIICTGFSERINKEQAEANKAKGFLMKPVVKSEMAKMVRKVLDEARVYKEN